MCDFRLNATDITNQETNGKENYRRGAMDEFLASRPVLRLLRQYLELLRSRPRFGALAGRALVGRDLSGLSSI